MSPGYFIVFQLSLESSLIPVIGWLVIILVALFGLGAELTARKRFYTTARQQQMP
jgi:hypothetical protein